MATLGFQRMPKHRTNSFQPYFISSSLNPVHPFRNALTGREITRHLMVTDDGHRHVSRWAAHENWMGDFGTARRPFVPSSTEGQSNDVNITWKVLRYYWSAAELSQVWSMNKTSPFWRSNLSMYFLWWICLLFASIFIEVSIVPNDS